jgi:phosphoribosylaminoimidazolecarboxamide formyltransferase/IMP cyclohydrolase
MTATTKKIKSALISVYHKDGLDKIIQKLNEQGVEIYSTGGTQSFIESKGIEVKSVESLTGYPSILGGRVKTLHPKIFGAFWDAGKTKPIRTRWTNLKFPPST